MLNAYLKLIGSHSVICPSNAVERWEGRTSGWHARPITMLESGKGVGRDRVVCVASNGDQLMALRNSYVRPFNANFKINSGQQMC
jgi:hypothetical protein